MFNCVPLSNLIIGVFLCDHWSLCGITLSGVAVDDNLSGGTVTGTLVGEIMCTSLGNTVVWFFSGCMVLDICAKLLMAYNWLSLTLKGVCDPGFLITCISYLVVLVACSVADCCFLLLMKFMSIMRHEVPLVYFR